MSDEVPPPIFFEQLSRKSDHELQMILAHSEDYLPQALEATREELKSRGKYDEVSMMAETTKALLSIVEAKSKSKPLGIIPGVSVGLAGLAFGLSPLLIGIVGITSAVFLRRKENKKTKQLWLFFICGVFLWAIWHVGIPVLKNNL